MMCSIAVIVIVTVLVLGIVRDKKLPSMIVDEVTLLYIVRMLFLTVSKYHNFPTAENAEE